MSQNNGSRKWLGWLLITFALSGFIEAFMPVTEPLSNPRSIALMLVVGFLTFGWVKAHSRDSGIVAPGGAALLAGAIPLLGVPVYLLRARGAKSGSIATLKALGFYLICGLVYEVMFYMGDLTLVAVMT